MPEKPPSGIFLSIISCLKTNNTICSGEFKIKPQDIVVRKLNYILWILNDKNTISCGFIGRCIGNRKVYKAMIYKKFMYKQNLHKVFIIITFYYTIIFIRCQVYIIIHLDGNGFGSNV